MPLPPYGRVARRHLTQPPSRSRWCHLRVPMHAGRGVAGPLGPRHPGAPTPPRTEDPPLSALRPRGPSSTRGRSPDRAGRSSSRSPGAAGPPVVRMPRRTRPPTYQQNASDGAGVTDPQTNTPAAGGPDGRGVCVNVPAQPNAQHYEERLRAVRRYVGEGLSCPGRSRVETSREATSQPRSIPIARLTSRHSSSVTSTRFTASTY